MKELVRRAAAAADPDDPDSLRLAQDDPEAWWIAHGAGALGYASLLGQLAPTGAARQGLLAEFFHPNEAEREEGLKVPGKAHEAVAQLVKRGFVRVILTTNFDRLMEQALEAVGVAAQVVARPEAVNGMAPLAHTDATVVKLHGDYKDLGTRNTAEELGEYPEEWTTLLGQVFDEYGLVICGWSGNWDTALVRALEAAPSRRYPLYWDSRSSKGEAAQRLIQNRKGLVLKAAGADELFGDLLSSVDALDRLSQPPLTTAMAVTRLKRYLPDPVRRIDLHDLVMMSAEEVANAIAEQPLSVPDLDGGQIQAIYNRHLEAVTPLTQMLVTGVWHDLDGIHDRLWIDVLQRLVAAGTAPLSSGTSGLVEARLWPALLAMTAMGVAAVRRGRERLIIRLATEAPGRGRMGTAEPTPTAQLLHPQRLLEKHWIEAMPRWGKGNAGWLYPSSHLLKADTRIFFEDLIPLDADFIEAFHGYEYRLGLIQEHFQGSPGGYRALSGEYVGEQGWSWDDGGIPLAELAFRKDAAGSSDWPWPEFLGAEDFEKALIAHREILKNYRRW